MQQAHQIEHHVCPLQRVHDEAMSRERRHLHAGPAAEAASCRRWRNVDAADLGAPRAPSAHRQVDVLPKAAFSGEDDDIFARLDTAQRKHLAPQEESMIVTDRHVVLLSPPQLERGWGFSTISRWMRREMSLSASSRAARMLNGLSGGGRWRSNAGGNGATRRRTRSSDGYIPHPRPDRS